MNRRWLPKGICRRLGHIYTWDSKGWFDCPRCGHRTIIVMKPKE